MSHYKPRPRYLSDDAARHAGSLCAALQPWIAAAIVGEKRHRLGAYVPPAPVPEGEPRGPGHYSQIINRGADEILADCAQVLAAAPEWDGALLAHHFARRGWPIDVELVRACHTWSTALMDRIMTNYRARQKEAVG